jgi:hypothetical protein
MRVRTSPPPSPSYDTTVCVPLGCTVPHIVDTLVYTPETTKNSSMEINICKGTVTAVNLPENVERRKSISKEAHAQIPFAGSIGFIHYSPRS